LLFRVLGENAVTRAYVEFAERLSKTICELCGRPSTFDWGDEGERQTSRCPECASRVFSSVASDLSGILREGPSDHEPATKAGTFLADKANTIEVDMDGLPAEVGPKECTDRQVHRSSRCLPKLPQRVDRDNDGS
jgi:DNA-directed RNA polymerase subunit RPC12/RpoP